MIIISRGRFYNKGQGKGFFTRKDSSGVAFGSTNSLVMTFVNMLTLASKKVNQKLHCNYIMIFLI